jgi:SAM-dependent methyltransferase
MCNSTGIDFAAAQLSEDMIKGKTVLEVGSRDVNGSLRELVERYGPASYTGIDIEDGPGVDVVLDANDVLERFGPESFDAVISTELLEHARDWRAAVQNMKGVLKPGGTLLVTTRSKGFHVHGYPWDFWRYELTDMERIFSDMDIGALDPDTLDPGVFMRARKSAGQHTDLSGIALYSVVVRRRVLDVTPWQERLFKFGFTLFQFGQAVLPERVRAAIKRLLVRRSRGAS